MNIKVLKFKDVKRAPYNPRVELKPGMPEYEKLAKSIHEFGHVLPMVFNQQSGNLVGGHQTMSVLENDGITEAKMSIVDLDDTQEKVLNIALNKTGGSWDDDKLSVLLRELNELPDFDFETTGFDIEELNDLIFSEPEDDNFDPDDALADIDEPITKLGDIILLGSHRIMCGDSTNADDVDKLIGGKKVDMVFTDPPYGIDIVQGNRVGGGGPTKFGKIGRGTIVPSSTYIKIRGDDTTDTAETVYNIAVSLNIKNIIIWGGNYFTTFLPPSPCWIIWDKREGIPSNDFADCEIAWTSFEKPARVYHHLWSGLLRKGDRKSELTTRVHPTQKPVGLHVNIINDFTVNDDIILDLFLGSGTTLIACEQTNRICYGMELDTKYCDVIVKRWEEFTEQKAIRPEHE